MKKILYILSIALVFASCDSVYRDLDECPAGSVTVNVFVERFGDEAALNTRAGFAESSEDDFSRRIHTLDYYLYKDGKLLKSGPLPNPLKVTSPFYTITFNNLEKGDYQLALMANCVEEIVVGDFSRLEDVNIYFPGIDSADDYFIDVFPFEVADNDDHTYYTQLKRLEGMVRYTFTKVDPQIRAIEVTMTGLTATGFMFGTYADDYSYTKRIVLDPEFTRAGSDPVPSVVASFPTMANGKSAWSIKLFNDDGDLAYYDRIISEDIQVVRNRLLDVTAVLEKGNYSFSIKVNTDWEGGASEEPEIIE